ncbi:MAG: hypothetical protein K0S78_3300 [Thermomicrobiales bacterium]|nr:hypothetical protein [Thermomicrobiales bacterium]
MKGDFSRRTFEETDHYSAVLIEQGRMLTDADLEEEHRILAHRIEREAADLIGGCGGPIDGAGFLIRDNGAGGLTIGEGRYYVEGILVANDADVDYVDQPDRYDVAAPNLQTPGVYRAVLDVWRRLITAIDDPTIREVALGGPTTSVREQTVWQVWFDPVEDVTCLTEPTGVGETTGQMSARTNPGVTPDDVCLVPATSGFKGLENQFYRVEILGEGAPHDVADTDDAIAIVALPAALNQVIVGEPTWTEGEAIEIYRSGTDRDPLQADLFLVVAAETADGQTTLTLNRERQTYGEGDDPRIRRVSTTFVWSRDNGSVVTAIREIAGADITVADLGPDDVRGFRAGHWVEIIDDGRELAGLHGVLAWVAEVFVETNIVRLTAPVAAPWFNKDRHPKLRRWDGAGAVRFRDLPGGAGWIDLEDGIQIRFASGVDDHYRTGDYWHFPARAITAEPRPVDDDPAPGEIGWPRDASDEPALRGPHGIDHAYCPLALITVADNDGDGDLETTFTDCRNLFPPVTELTTLHYVGGDGQEGVPNPAKPSSLIKLQDPLEVRVANGMHPVFGAQVQFTIVEGNGQLQIPNPVTISNADGTNPDGIAAMEWRLDGKTQPQQVDAQLLDIAGNPVPGQVVHFHARLSRASDVSYDPKACPELVEAKAFTVQKAIDALCQRESGGGCCCVVVGPGGEFERIDAAVSALLERGESDVCLCLLPGDHKLPTEWRLINEDPRRRISIKIAGCGLATRLDIDAQVLLRGLSSFTLAEVDVFYSPHGDRESGWMELDQVREVRVDACRIAGQTWEPISLLQILNATTVYVGNSTFVATGGEQGMPRQILEGFESLTAPWADGFSGANWRKFVASSQEVAVEFANRPLAERQEAARVIVDRVDTAGFTLSPGEARAYRRFAATLVQDPVDPHALVDQLIAIRDTDIQAAPGSALEIGARGRQP